MYSLRLYKYRDSYVLYTPTVQLFSPLLHTHTLLVQTHKHDVSAPCLSPPPSIQYLLGDDQGCIYG